MFLQSSEYKRTVVHMDLDCFFVSVSRLLNSKLIGMPVIVGGGERGVVAACSYETRKFGVHSAMPIKQAMRLCPDAIIVKGDYDEYSKKSDEVTQIIQEQVPLYERSSIDEFYMELTGMDRFFGCYKHATELREKIMHETGLPISFGMSANKTVSKVATNYAKPNNHKKVEHGDEKVFLAPLSVKKIPMIGDKTYLLLRSMGIEYVRTLQDMPQELLQNVLGDNGNSIWRKANGIDNTPVEPYTEQKSMSQEETFETDTIDTEKLKNILIAMSEKLCFRLRTENKLTACVTVKIRYSNFDTHTMQCRIPYTGNDHTIIARVKELFDKLYNRRMLIRLVGVKFSHLVGGGHQVHMFEDSEHILNLYQAMDKLRILYGENAIHRAVAMNNSLRTFNPFNGISSSPNEDTKLSDTEYEYLLVVNPPRGVYNDIKAIKKYFADTFKYPQAEKYPAYITLAQLKMEENKEEQLVQAVEELCMHQQPTEVTIKNFKFFGEHTLYLDILRAHGLIDLVKGLKEKLHVARSRSFFNYHPNITIARGFTKEGYMKVKPVFENKHYDNVFITSGVTLLKRKDAFEKSITIGEYEFCNTRNMVVA